MVSRSPAAGFWRNLNSSSAFSSQTQRPLSFHSRRYISGKKTSQSWAEVNPPVDPRPTWRVTLMKVANLVFIPGIFFYAVFQVDFGDREHVFMPARRWLDAQKAALLSITPAEREAALVDTQQQGPDTSER